MEMLPVTAPDSGSSTTRYTIEAKNLSYTCGSRCDSFPWLLSWCRASPKVLPKAIIKNVSLEAKPGEITAIAGPSGAGKTTLLEILAGKVHPGRVSGEVLVNGCPVNAGAFRKLSGFVTQDDTFFPCLTVEETLTYSALLRLPGGKGLAHQRVKWLMKDLGLDHVAGSRVGKGSSRGISGGERRRLSIGVELVHDPPVLVIDEPTTGLDSASALHIVSLLKMMVVHKGKTVILSIHQPGFRILQLFDRLVLMSDGHILHEGSLEALEDELKHGGHCIPCHINVLEFAIEVGTYDRRRQKAEEEDGAKQYSNLIGIEGTTSSYANSYLKEVQILSERFCKNTYRTKELFATKVVQSIVVGSILGTVYMKLSDNQGKAALQARLGFFAFTLSFLLSSTTEALPIFLQERRIFMRETSSGSYRVSSYAASHALVLVPFLLLTGLLYSAPAYWLVGLRRDPGAFLYFALVAWVVGVAANALTACCAALAPDFIVGASGVAGLMGAFFLFSGYFIGREEIPRYWIFMHYLSLFKYPFESLIVNEYGGKGSEKCVERSGRGGECVLYGGVYLREEQGLDESQKWSNLGVMVGFVVGYRFLCWWILWWRWRTSTR